MKANILTLAITLTVGIILAGSLLMPVISDATETERTFINEGFYYMTDLGEDTLTYTYDGTIWTIDGEAADISISDSTTLIAGDGFIVRTNGQLRGSQIASPASIESLTVSASGIVMQFTRPDATTGTTTIVGDVYYCAVSEKTMHTLSKYDIPTYLHKDSEILADGISGIAPGTASVFKIEGSIEDGFTVTPQNTSVVVSDVVANYSEVSGFIDLYKLESITFKTTYNTDERTQTYSSYVVPASVTSELTNHLSNGEITILNALPILIIVALVMMAAGVLYLKRDD